MITDLLDSTSYYFGQNHFSISVVTSKPIDPRYGEVRIWTRKYDEAERNYIETHQCSEEQLETQLSYWEPRIG